MNIKITEETIRKIFDSTVTVEKDPEKFLAELGTVILNIFLSVRVIGELCYSLKRETFDIFKETLKAFFEIYRPSSLKHMNTKESRGVLSFYLVWAGTFFYIDEKERPFWSYIFEDLHIKDNKISTLLGHMFMDCIRENALEVFDSVTDRQGYVTRILLHGLIPRACMDLFMKEFILPELLPENSFCENGKSLINKWIDDRERIKKSPKCLQTFLQYGHPVNHNILDRILYMAKNMDKDKPLIYWQWGLPEYMVKSFQKISGLINKSSIGDLPVILFNPSLGFTPFMDGENFSIDPPGEEYMKHYGHFNFPEFDGMKIPLFIFNGNDYKPVNNNYGDELFIVYPEESEVEISGTSIKTAPVPLYGKWKGWQSIYCRFEREFFVNYKGHDITGQKMIETEIPFKISEFLLNKPVLVTGEELPSWIRCDFNIPVITHPRNVKMFFTLKTLLFWRNASCEVVRMDREEEQQSIFQINYEPEDKSIFVPLKSARTGLYEIRIKGSIGRDDIILPFLYVPLEEYKREFSEENSCCAKSFSLVFSKVPEFTPLENTAFRLYGNKVNLFPQEDRGQALLGIKLFSHKGKDVNLFFERSSVRWAREKDFHTIQWYNWKTVNEYLPLREMDMLQGDKFLVYIDEDLIEMRFLLYVSLASEAFPLLSCEAERFKSIWVLNLHNFISQLKSLGDFKEAHIIMRHKHMPLLTLRRITEFEDFTVETVKVKDKTEEVRINWKSHAMDFLSNRVIRLYPLEYPEKIISVNIKDFERPPLVMDIKSPATGGVWCASIEIGDDRKFERPARETKWMRIPDRWLDWLDWDYIHRDKTFDSFNIWEKVEEEKKLSLIPWSYFLYLFYHGTEKYLIDEFKYLTGKEIIMLLIPFSKGSVWQVKNNSGITLSLNVVSSSLQNMDEKFFYNYSPSEWYSMPSEFEITLSVIDTGEIWKFFKRKKDKSPSVISSSGKMMSVDIWLKDILKSNIIQAEMPLEKIWHKPVYLPVLKWINREDQLFVTGKNTSSGIISDLMDPEINKKAIKLLDRWKEISLDPLVVKILQKRMYIRLPETLTGSLAFICRLKSRGYEVSSQMEHLLEDTFDFIKVYLQGSFLRDLIMSEILISWYAENLIWKVQE